MKMKTNSTTRLVTGLRPTHALLAAIILAGASMPAVAQRGQERNRAESRSPESPDRPHSRKDRRGGERGRRPGPPKPLWKRMTKKERQRMESFVEEHFPRMYIELKRLKSNDPRRYMTRMSRVAPEVRRIMETLEVQPRRGALMIQERRYDIEMRRLARRYRSAEGDEQRARLRAEFREISAKAFDCKQQRREMGIRELEARIAELKQRHEEATRMRDKLVEETVRERLGRAGGNRAGRPGRP